MKDSVDAHKREFGEESDVLVRVPQATTLFGIFSNCIKGWSLVCNTENGISISISRRSDSTVRIVNTYKQDKKKFAVGTSKYRKEDRWANAAKAVFFALNKHGFELTGCNITIIGEGCNTCGYSFASQIIVGLLLAFNKLFSFNQSRIELFNIAVFSLSFFPSEIVRYRDLWVLFFGEKNKVYLFDERNLAIKEAIYSISPESSYILDSALPYSVLTPEYDEFFSRVPELLEIIKRIIPSGVDFRALTEKELRTYTVPLTDEKRRFVTFLYLSSEYSRRAFDAIEKKDGLALSRILSLYQKSIMFDAELTSPELDWIFKRCLESDSVMGMATLDIGIASSFLCIVDEKKEFPNNQRVEEYERIFGFHPTKRPFVPLDASSVE